MCSLTELISQTVSYVRTVLQVREVSLREVPIGEAVPELYSNELQGKDA
jgi:hypothetical protein